MQQSLKAAVLTVVAVSLVALSGCGGTAETAAPADTIVDLSGRSYATVAPVTNPPDTTVANTLAAGAVTTQETTYTVQAGESISIIAAKFKIVPIDLAKYNGLAGINSTIFPDQVLKIPAGATIPESQSSSGSSSGDSSSGDSSESSSDETTAPTEPGQGCTYTIKAGDNPTKVAKKTGVTYDALKQANSSTVMSTFLVGAELVIPPPGKC